MISLLVCSVNPDVLTRFKANVAATIGVPYEIVVHDNRTTNEGLCKVYNRLAKQATYDILCFVHEDVQFNTPEWGKETIRGMQLPEVGIIGFAGSILKSSSLSGWGGLPRYLRYNYTQHFANGSVRKFCLNPQHQEFAQVAILDGLCLMMPKSRWQENPFDEEIFDQFHLYDLDISLQMAQQYKNYVCYTIEIEHFSAGSYSPAWLHYTEVFHQKWADKLPFCCYPMDEQELANIEKITSKIFLRTLMHQRIIPKETVGKYLRIHYQRYPLYKPDLLLKYLCYKPLEK